MVLQDKASELALQDALVIFNEFQGKRLGVKVVIHKNNSDGRGNSWGSHLNMLLARKTVESSENLKYLIYHYLPFQISRIILIGGGKVGAECDQPACQFQISQRADFFTRISGSSTMENRPIFNLRDEPHADPEKYFRLHDIFTDALMCEQAMIFRVALTQVALAMIEDRFWNQDLFPENPVKAMQTISRDLQFKNKILLESGQLLTGLEILRKYLERGKEYVLQEAWPEAYQGIFKDAEVLLDILEQDPLKAFGILDWPTAYKIALEAEGNSLLAMGRILRFREMSERSLYDVYSKHGLMKRVVSEEMIFAATKVPPQNTRAAFRGALIKKFGDQLTEIGWAVAELRLPKGAVFIQMNDPTGVDEDLWRMLH